RHTRSKRDWSSDVCSSDLPQMGLPLMLRLVLIRTGTPVISAKAVKTSARKGLWSPLTVWTRAVSLVWITAGMRARARSVTPLARSEERRVGEECRAGGWEL